MVEGRDQRAAPSIAGGSLPIVATVVGMAFFWQLFRYTNLASVLPPYASTLLPFEGAASVSPVTLFYAVTLALALGTVAMRQRCAWIHRKQVVLGAGLFSSILSCAMTMLRGRDLPVSGMHTVLDGATLLAVSFAFVTLALAWARVCRSMALDDPKRLVYALCVSSLASIFVSLAFSLQVPRLEFLVVVAPACSALCLWCSVRGGEPTASAAVLNRTELVAARVPSGVVAVLVLLLAFVVCIKGASDLLYLDGSRSTLYIKHFVTIAELVIIISVCLFAAGMSRFAFLGWAVLVGGVVSGLVVLFSFPDSSSAFQFGLGTIAAAKTCLELFMFIVVASARRDDAARSILLLLVVPETVAYLLGCGVLPLVFGMASISAEGSIGFLSLAAGAVIAVSTFLIMGSLALKSLDDVEAADDSSTGEDAEDDGAYRFDQVTAAYDLTKRESETAYLFFKGYSAKRIAELHFVSLNTTQSHLRSVYKKLDVHSRQDLIDLVEKHSL